MSEFRGWKVKGRKEKGLAIPEGCEHIKGKDVCMQAKGGGNVGLLMHLFDDRCAPSRQDCAWPFYCARKLSTW
jgi:hypothetical protein